MAVVGARRALGRGIGSLMPDAPRETDVVRLAQRVEELERELEVGHLYVEGMSAEKMYLEALGFIENNPSIWDVIVSHARDAAVHGRRYSMKREFEEMRDKYVPVGDERWRLRNALAAPLVRFLLIDVPEVAPFVERGRSKVDRYFNGVATPPRPYRGFTNVQERK